MTLKIPLLFLPGCRPIILDGRAIFVYTINQANLYIQKLSLPLVSAKNLAHPVDFRVDQVLQFPARHEDVAVVVRKVSFLCAPHLGD